MVLHTVRDADERDVDLLVALNRFVQDPHIAALPMYFKHPESAALTQSFRSKVNSRDTRIWIASIGNEPVGYAVAIRRERPENALCLPRTFYEIDEIAVSPAHRQQGAGRALVDHVLEQARRLGIHDVELTSWSFNTEAHAAFEALGFRPLLVRFQRASHESE